MTSTSEPRRGEIWNVRFDLSEGAEISKIRPAVVVNVPEAGRLLLYIVVPITAWDERYSLFPWHTKLPPTPTNGLTKTSSADSFQVKSVSQKRLLEKLGEVTEDQLNNIVAAIALCVGYQG